MGDPGPGPRARPFKSRGRHLHQPSVVSIVLLLLAADPRWGLTFRSAEGCITPAELAERIEHRLGRATFGARPDLVIDGYLKPDGSQTWRARLTLVDAEGTVKGSREVTSKGISCRSIDDALT